jgi:hypothetical protein
MRAIVIRMTVMFFSASSYKDALAVLDSGINDILEYFLPLYNEA